MKRLALYNIVRCAQLHKSTPDPYMFGNPPNSPTKDWSAENWLTSLFHFSFAEYSGPSPFGVLRVLNDDLVQPKRGFGTHQHSNMEIVTYVVSGHSTHKDSMGTEETIGPGSVQFMSAGTGIRHSEFNASPKEPLRFIQIWIDPRQKNGTPNYGSYIPPKEQVEMQIWNHLVSDVQQSHVLTPIKVNQDVNIWVGYVKDEHTLEFHIDEGRKAYVVCLDGEALLNRLSTIEKHDAVKFEYSGIFMVTPQPVVSLLVIEMKA